MGSSVIYPYDIFDIFGIFGNSDFGPVCEPRADWMLARPRERRRSHRRPDTLGSVLEEIPPRPIRPVIARGMVSELGLTRETLGVTVLRVSYRDS
jgi:hypothetical protein